MTLPSLAANLSVRFFWSGTAAEAVCHRALQADFSSARLSPRFKLYYRLRPWLPIAVRQALQRGRNRRLSVSADWYIPVQFLTELHRSLLSEPEDRQVLSPWPVGYRQACVFTHDVETIVGMRNIPQLASLEESLGVRSSWNLVPRAYSIDYGLVRDLQQRGFEIGVHGYNHDGLLFSSRSTFRRRLPFIQQALEQFSSEGFRAPMVHRQPEWMQELPVSYDASYFDIDPFQAMPGGIGSLWPFILGRFVELPYTLPQDHTLLVTLGETSDRVWRKKWKVIQHWRGMALLVTHPDYLDTHARRDVYRRFLEFTLEQPETWHALPRQVAVWWRRLDAAQRVDLKITDSSSSANQAQGNSPPAMAQMNLGDLIPPQPLPR